MWPLRLLGLDSGSARNGGLGRLGSGSSGWNCGAEGRLPETVLSVDLCLSNLSMSNRAVSLCLSSSSSRSFASFTSSSRFLTEAITACTMSSASSPKIEPVSTLSVVGVGGSCMEPANGDARGVGGPDGTFLAK